MANTFFCPHCRSQQLYQFTREVQGGTFYGTHYTVQYGPPLVQCQKCEYTYDQDTLAKMQLPGMEHYSQRENRASESAFYIPLDERKYLEDSQKQADLGRIVMRALVIVALTDGVVDEVEMKLLQAFSEELLGWKMQTPDLNREAQEALQTRENFVAYLQRNVRQLHGETQQIACLIKGTYFLATSSGQEEPNKMLCVRYLPQLLEMNPALCWQFVQNSRRPDV